MNGVSEIRRPVRSIVRVLAQRKVGGAGGCRVSHVLPGRDVVGGCRLSALPAVFSVPWWIIWWRTPLERTVAWEDSLAPSVGAGVPSLLSRDPHYDTGVITTGTTNSFVYDSRTSFWLVFITSLTKGFYGIMSTQVLITTTSTVATGRDTNTD